MNGSNSIMGAVGLSKGVHPLRAASSLTAVLDIGKTNRSLALLNDAGELVLESARPCSVVDSGFGYTAIDTSGTQHWVESELQQLGELRSRLAHVIVTTHGAAFAAVRDGALAFPVPDYEWSGFEEASPQMHAEASFAETLSPVLPRGLNMGVQLNWLETHHPELMSRAECFLPYPQYWAYWLSGVASSEVSSLGCHTLLWCPETRDFSGLAHRRGWAERFAPMRRAWETLGTVRRELAAQLGIPRSVQIHVGVHDSNACLAHYLRNWPRMTLVSTGTWVIVMAPGSSTSQLDPSLDQLGNVSVRGESVPTGRFMGGREFDKLCAGAEPALANIACAESLLRRGLRITPSFEDQGGPFTRSRGKIWLDGNSISFQEWRDKTTPTERATGAALYTAYVMAWLVKRLGGFGPIVVDGPFAHNAVLLEIFATLMHHIEVFASDDPLDGTVRGSWSLSRWTEPGVLNPRIREVRLADALTGPLLADFERWLRAAAPEARHS
jgi:sugar (pentulose or hexulose) kinase